jgi:hypothetical protein
VLFEDLSGLSLSDCHPQGTLFQEWLHAQHAREMVATCSTCDSRKPVLIEILDFSFLSRHLRSVLSCRSGCMSSSDGKPYISPEAVRRFRTMLSGIYALWAYVVSTFRSRLGPTDRLFWA